MNTNTARKTVKAKPAPKGITLDWLFSFGRPIR